MMFRDKRARRAAAEPVPEGQLQDVRAALGALAPGQRKTLLPWLRARVRADEDAARAEVRAARAARRQTRAKSRTLKQAVWWSAAAFLLFFASDAAIFRWGWYTRYLEPDSSAGQLELHLFWFQHTLPVAIPEVAVAGDSRIGEGFSARAAAQEARGKIRFWNMGVAGSSPRTWFYLLRDADPARDRFAAVVLALDHYSDWDEAEDIRNRLIDLNYLAGRLRLSDCPEFAASYHDRSLRHSVFAGCVFKGIPLRRDFHDFLADPDKRFDLTWDWRNHGQGYVDGYAGKPESLAGLSVDWAKRRIAFPPGALDWQRNSARNTLLPLAAPQTGALTAYRKQWLGRIIDLYKGSPTRVVFLELPRAPLPLPESPPADGRVPARFIESLNGRPRVTVLPAATFRDLERPDLFADGLHLNHDGRPIFSARLGGKAADILGVR